MKVGIYTGILKEGHQTRGIGNYTRNLISSLKEEIEVIEFNDLTILKNVDLVHYPSFDFFKSTLPLFKKFPTVVTIHDVIPLLFTKHYPAGIKGKINLQRQKISLKSTKAIITDSKTSKDDIREKLGIKEEKIFPIYLAPSKNFRVISDEKKLKDVKAKYNLPDKFLIYYGDINWNKNLYHIAKAATSLGVNIVMVGNNFHIQISNHPELIPYRKFLEEFKDNPLVHLKNFMPIEDLVCTINQAEASILASYYEGFGLPIVESQACGIPVITSPISSMKEVGKESVIYVDPYEIPSIKDGIKKLLENADLRKEIIEKGFENVKRFSWNICAEETIKVYKYALEN